MRKILAASFLALVLLLHPPLANAAGEPLPFFWVAVSTSTTAGPFPLGGYRAISFQITCPSACLATVTVLFQNNTGDTPAPVLTLNNMAANAVGYYMPPVGYVSFQLVWTSGTVSGNLVRQP